jgi:hypothetical protein
MAITISGSGITSANIADGTIVSGDIADGTIVSGDIADGTIVNADVNDVAASKLTGALPAISGASLTGLPAGGITEADQWRLTTDKGCNTGVQYITANWERVDTDGFGKLGTGISESSGIFSFPSTGMWLVTFQAGTNKLSGESRYVQNHIYTTVNNSTYDVAVTAWSSVWNSGATTYTTSQSSFIFDVTSTTTHKLKTAISPAAYVVCDGDSGQNVTCLTFIKLGDT